MNDFWLVMWKGQPIQRIWTTSEGAEGYCKLMRKTEVVHVRRYQPVLEVIDGVMKDKSQDADWLRLRYFEMRVRIEQLGRLVALGITEEDVAETMFERPIG